jgi:hypothetical protein
MKIGFEIMSVQANPEDIEQIRRMSSQDVRPKEELRASPNPAFQIQLEEARVEWKRRHAKKKKKV